MITTRIYTYLVIVVILLCLGFAPAWYIQGRRIQNLKNDLGNANTKIEVCLAANNANTDVITLLQARTVDANEVCRKKLLAKDDLIAKIKMIMEVNTSATTTNVANISITDDAVLNALNSMYNRSTNH